MSAKKNPKTRKKRPARHSVSASVGNWTLAKRESAVRFVIKRKRRMVGTLTVGRGSIAWTPANGKKSLDFTWRQFEERIYRMQGRE